MNVEAVVVAIGARTALGLTAAQTGFLYRAAHVAMREAPIPKDAEDTDGVTMCFLPTIDPRVVGAERTFRLAAPALHEALTMWGPAAAELRMKLVVSVDENIGPDHAGALTAWLHQRVQQISPQAQVETVARGGAGPGFALQSAFEALARGSVQAVILGGVHSDYDPERIRALADAGRLFSPENLDAIVPGELAAFVVLMRPDLARTFKLAPLAELHAVATAYDKIRPDNEEPAFQAVGLTAAVRKAGQMAVDYKLAAGWLLTDLTFERFRLHEHQSMIARTQLLWTEPQYWDPPALRLGALGAAAIPLHIVLAAEGWKRGWGPHPIAMSIAATDTGERAAVLLSRPGREVAG